MPHCCKNIISFLIKASTLSFLLILILGYLVQKYEEPIDKMKPEILVRNPQIIYGLVFFSLTIYSLYKSFSILIDNLDSNYYETIQTELNFNNILTLKLSYLGRIIYTVLSLEVLFFFYNFVAESILLFPGPLSDMKNKFFKIIFYFLYIEFTIFSPIFLIIPTYEFISFPYLLYSDPYCHLKSFTYIDSYREYNEKNYNKINHKINKSFMQWGIYFSLSFIISNFSDLFGFVKDVIEYFILLFNFYHYMTLIFCYCIFSINFSIKYIKKLYYDKDSFEKNNLQINLLTYIKKQNDEYDLNICDRIIILLKTIMIFLSLVGFLYLFCIKALTFSLSSFLFIFWFLILLELSFTLNFPIKYFGCSKYEEEKKDNSTKINISLFISCLLSFGMIIAFILINIFVSDKENYENIFQDIQLITTNYSKNNTEKTFHSFCNSKLYDIPIYLYQPFINDAYYHNKNNFSSFNYQNYTKLFFEDNYDIKVMDNLINENNNKKVKMIPYFIKNKKNNNNVTILSIKGTSYKRDIFLDAQLYFPSLLLNLLNTFSNLDQQKEAISFALIEYALSLPYRIFFQFSIIEEYLVELNSAYYKYINTSNSNNKNIVLVGHSLGGGLAKILGKKVGEKAISLSGPGINAFHSLWK